MCGNVQNYLVGHYICEQPRGKGTPEGTPGYGDSIS